MHRTSLAAVGLLAAVLALACGGPGVSDSDWTVVAELPPVEEELVPCDPGEDWSEAAITSWLGAVSVFEGEQGERLVFATTGGATLDGVQISTMVLAEGDRDMGSFIRVFTDPPVNGFLEPDGAGSSRLELEGHGVLTPVGCSR